MTENNSARTSIQVIERMMDLVDVLAKHHEPMNLKRLASETGLHTSTAHRILAMMVSHRIVDRIEPGKYRLGIRWVELAHVVKSRIDVRAEALPVMQRLNFELRETVHLCTRQGDEVLYVERAIMDRQTTRATRLIGTRAPLHVTAVGKVFLIEDGEAGWHDYAARTRLPAYTDKSIRELAALSQELDQARTLGYALDNEETEAGIACVGAGIRNDEGNLVAALSVSAPASRLKKAWGPVVALAAERVSLALGYRKAST